MGKQGEGEERDGVEGSALRGTRRYGALGGERGMRGWERAGRGGPLDGCCGGVEVGGLWAGERGDEPEGKGRQRGGGGRRSLKTVVGLNRGEVGP